MSDHITPLPNANIKLLPNPVVSLVGIKAKDFVMTIRP